MRTNLLAAFAGGLGSFTVTAIVEALGAQEENRCGPARGGPGVRPWQEGFAVAVAPDACNGTASAPVTAS